MKIAICDDEIYYVKNIKERINDYCMDGAIIIDEYLSAEVLLDHLYQNDYDIIFLDIIMRGIDGIDVARQVKEVKPDCIIIFVSGNLQYIHDSYKVGAFQFLTKPINNKLFDEELERAICKYKSMNIIVTIHTTVGTISLKMSSILYIETAYKNFRLSTINPTTSFYGNVTALKCVRDILLNHNFYYVNRSTLVNIDHVHGIIKDYVLISNGDVQAISKTKKKDFKEIYLKSLKKEGGLKP